MSTATATNYQENQKPNINNVRQVLMNELGLTRDSVRQLMCEIVKEAAEKFVSSGALQKTLEDEIQKQLRVYRYDSTTLKKVIGDAVAESVQKQIVAKLKFDMTGSLAS